MKLAATCLLLAALPAAARAQERQAPQTPPVTASQPKDAADEPKREVKFVWKEHPSLRFGKDVRIDFRARFQADKAQSDAPLSDDDAEGGSFDVARRRVGVEGTIGKFADFQVEAELKDDDRWRDVYLNYSQFTTVQVMGGKFKIPFSLDETTSTTNLDFVYRSRIAAQLAPGRDRGGMVHGRLFDRTLIYEAGVFEHDGDNARTKAGDRVIAGTTIAWRVAAEPFRPTKSPLEDLHVGFAMTGGEVPTGQSGLRGRTVLDESFFSSRLFVSGQRRRMGVEFRVRPGPASIRAEYIRATEERLGQSVEDGDLSNFVASGWYVSGSYVVTGDAKNGVDEPRRPIFQGGIGAIEVAARLEQFELGSDGGVGEPSTSPRSDNVQRNRDRALTFGVNWYLNRWVKVQANFVREDISDPERGPLPERPQFWSQVFRLQFVI